MYNNSMFLQFSDPGGEKERVCEIFQEVQQHTKGILQRHQPVSIKLV